MTEIEKKQESSNDGDFAALFEQSIKARDNFEPGDKVEGTVAGFTRESIFVDISGKSEAVIPAEEFRNDDGSFKIKVGDRLTAYVIASGSSGVELTSSIGRGRVNAAILSVAKENEIPVEGVVTAKINGGFSISIDGMKAFCPISQIDRKYSNNDSDYLNKKFQFAIMELKGGRDCVVSRRILLDRIQKDSEETLKTKINAGDICPGVVTRIAEYGIFVDFGGIEGLVPRSELSRSRSTAPDNFKIGDSVTVKLINLDWAAKKYSLSIKETEKDPWDSLTIKEGDHLSGTITNTIKGGAFVELSPGLEGFIPISRMSKIKRTVKVDDVVSKGDHVNVSISSIDRSERRISLELITGETDPWSDNGKSIKESVIEATIENVRTAGLTVRLDNGMEGFVPRSELSCDRNADVMKIYAAGSIVKLVAKDIRKDEKKLILSQREVERMEERENIKQYMKQESSEESASLGSQFGNMLEDFKKKMTN